MSVDVNNESGFAVDEAEFAALSRYVLDAMHVHPQTDVSIRLVDTEAMTDLHVRWMDEPGPTDVLSFPMDELDEPFGPRELGDVVICPEHTVDLEEAVVHGVLHLTGMDHETDDGEMLAVQAEIMGWLR
jgi:probable rRNA maturation factor